MKKYFAVILGAGPSGYTCAVRLAQAGEAVAVIERDFIGGICTNWGCTPSKAMIESAKIARTVDESGKYGVMVENSTIDFSKVANRRNTVVESIRHEQTKLLQHHNIDIYQGEGEILSDHTVKVRMGKLDPEGASVDYTGEEVDIETEHIIIATGSQPLIPKSINTSDPSVVSSNRLISINELPKSLAIVGGGVIGLEFSTIFSNLGSKVTVIECLDRVLAGMDSDISEEITRSLKERGVNILTGHKVLSIKDGTLDVENQHTGELVKEKADLILIAIGRKAVILNDALDHAGIDYTSCGIHVDDYMKTNVPGIWAIGDTTGKSILAHVGIQQGHVCAENILSLKKNPDAPLRKMDYEVIPTVVYSIPEIAGVGTVPQDMDGVSVYKLPFTANLRANIEDYSDGFVKVWIKKRKVIAAQMIGYNVSEFIQEMANMIALKTDIEDVARIIHPHPTYAEISRTIFEYALGKAVDVY